MGRASVVSAQPYSRADRRRTFPRCHNGRYCRRSSEPIADIIGAAERSRLRMWNNRYDELEMRLYYSSKIVVPASAATGFGYDYKV